MEFELAKLSTSPFVRGVMPAGTALRLFPVGGGGATELPLAPRSTEAPDAPSRLSLSLRDVHAGAWQALFAHPYGFTGDSLAGTAASVASLWSSLCPGAAGGVWAVQASGGVALLEGEGEEVAEAEAGAHDVPAPFFVPVKRTLGSTRLLLLLPANGGGCVGRASEGAPARDCPTDCLTVTEGSEALAHVVGLRTSPGPDRALIDASFTALLAWVKGAVAGQEGGFGLRVAGGRAVLTHRPEAAPLVEAATIARMVMAVGGAAPGRGSAAAPAAGQKRPRPAEAGEEAGGPPASRLARAPAAGVRLAVIVPFRDQPEQNRREQLRLFAAGLPAFLASPAVSPALEAFHVIVVEQSNDGFKFNRGKALNVGYALATAPDRAAHGLPPEPFNAFCFHDVDLMPGAALGGWYARAPHPSPLHLGAAWSRYPYDTYVGGILTLSRAAVEACNGFPNDFWGWGGEDDELYARLRDARLLPLSKPGPEAAGAVTDLEELLIARVGGQRAGVGLASGGRSEWRNMWKREGLARHEATWRSNGVSALTAGRGYRVLASTALGPAVTRVSVDLCGAADPHAARQEASEPLPEPGRR